MNDSKTMGSLAEKFIGFYSLQESCNSLLRDFSIGTDYCRSFFDGFCADPYLQLQAASSEENPRHIPT